MSPRRRFHAKPVSRSGSGRKRLLIFLLLVAFGAVSFAVLRSRPPQPPSLRAPTEQAEDSARPRPAPKRSKPKPAKPASPPLTPSKGPAPTAARLALVIDDLGRSLAEVETLERLGVPLSYAVLPFESHTREVVAALAAGGRELLCHLPMEAEGGNNPGPGALEFDMTGADLGAATARALAAVPGAVGVNNHMGSRLSADRQRMAAVLAVIGGRGLFYLDSRTSAESVGYRTALELGVASAERQVFLDRDPETAAIDAQFARWLALAKERGSAIAIGHPYPSTFEVLAREVPKAKAQGFEFVPVSYLLNDAGDGPL